MNKKGSYYTLVYPIFMTFSANTWSIICYPVADPGGVPRGPWPPALVQISHKKDGHQRRPYRFHVSCPPHPAAGSDAVTTPRSGVRDPLPGEELDPSLYFTLTMFSDHF